MEMSFLILFFFHSQKSGLLWGGEKTNLRFVLHQIFVKAGL